MRHHRSARPIGLAAGIAITVVLLQAAVLAMFVWPPTATAPRDLPIVLAGPPAATHQLAAALSRSHPGAFAITTTKTMSAADAAVRNRAAYGALVLGRRGLALHVASAASPPVAALLEQAVTESPAARGHVPVTDLAAGSAADPHGVGLALGLIPLIITSLVAGAAITFAVASRAARVLGVLVYALLAGTVAAAVLQPAFGVLSGDFGDNASGIALLALAAAAASAGLAGLLRGPGAAIAALLIFFVGIPLSGLTSAPELLPRPWGTIGQLLPPGAGGELLRSTSYFAGAGAAGPLWVLGAWAAAGILLLVAVPARTRTVRRAAVPAGDPVAA